MRCAIHDLDRYYRSQSPGGARCSLSTYRYRISRHASQGAGVTVEATALIVVGAEAANWLARTLAHPAYALLTLCAAVKAAAAVPLVGLQVDAPALAASLV